MIDIDLLKHMLYCDKQIAALEQTWVSRYVEVTYKATDNELYKRVMKHIEDQIKNVKHDRLLTLRRLGLSKQEINDLQGSMLRGIN